MNRLRNRVCLRSLRVDGETGESVGGCRTSLRRELRCHRHEANADVVAFRRGYCVALALILILCAATFSVAAEKDVATALDAMFSDHVILQREMPVPVWGTAQAGATVTVAFRGQTVTGAADEKGKWLVKLASMTVQGEPAELVVTIGATVLTCKDVLVGDVYFCSGQSNMEMAMQDFPSTADDQAKALLPKLRYFRVGGADPPASAKDSKKAPTKGDDKAAPAEGEGGGDTDGKAPLIRGVWLSCTPETVKQFGATGFYFARKILQETGVPVGLINNARGSSRIERWIPPEGFPLVPGLVKPDGTLNQRPSDRYSHYFSNTRKVIPFAIKGMLWYQGEHNTWTWDNEVNYCAKMNAMVTSLRQIWGQGDFPFYYVQLPQFAAENPDPAGGGSWSKVRLGQLRALSSIPNAGMAITLDCEDRSIHPDNKPEVGERLARLALVRDYGQKDLTCSGPVFKEAAVEGGKMRVRFDHVGKGLMVGLREEKKPVQEVAGGKLKHFAIAERVAGGGGKPALRWVWADAAIDGDTVVVSSPEIKAPVAVQYANSDRPTGANLYNKDGLPASPFVANLTPKEETSKDAGK